MSDPRDTAPLPADAGEPGREPEATTAELPVPAGETVASGVAPRRRRRAPFVIGGVVAGVLLLAGAGALIGENVARDQIAERIRAQLVTAFDLDPAAPVEITVAYDRPALVQLAGGALDRVDIDVPAIAVGGLGGSATIRAEGLATDDTARVERLDVRYAVDGDAISGLAQSVGGDLDLRTVSLAEPNLLVGTAFEFLGIEVPLEVALAPGVDAGAITLTVESVTFGDQEFSTAELLANPLLSGIASTLLEKQSVCVAQSLPADLVLDAASVEGDELVVRISGDGARLDGSAGDGSCG